MSKPCSSVTVTTTRDLDPGEQYDTPIGRNNAVRITRLEVTAYRVVYRGKRVRADGSLGAPVGDYVMRTGDETEDALRLASHPLIMRQTVDAWSVAYSAANGLEQGSVPRETSAGR